MPHGTLDEIKQPSHYKDWPNAIGFNAEYQQHEPVQLPVNGNIPSYAAGILYRTGPQVYKVGLGKGKGEPFEFSHWFDGLSQVHRFQLQAPEGPDSPMKVFYNSRRITDDLVESIKKTGKLEAITFGQKRDPCQSFFKKVMTTFSPTTPGKSATSHNVGVTVSINMLNPSNPAGKSDAYPNIKTLHTKTDANLYMELNPETLEPLGVVDQTVLHPDLKGPLSGAHPRSDPITGDLYNYNIDFGRKSTYRVFGHSAATGKTTVLAKFNAEPAYLHSMFLTKSYAIVCIWNSTITAGGVSILWQRSIVDAMAPFDKSAKAKWYVVDRVNGKGLVATYETDPFFCFHTINAWEEPSPKDPSVTDIVADAAVYENLDVLKRFYYDNLTSLGPGAKAYDGKKGDSTVPYYQRCRLPNVTAAKSGIRAGAIEFVAPREDSPELPTLNPAYITRPHRYTYGATNHGKSSFMDVLVKFDNVVKESKTWAAPGHTPGEPIFVADPAGTEEDDGVLLSVVLDGHAERSYLLCLDAKTLEEKGRAEVPGVVGFGFHGKHIPTLSKSVVET